MKRPGAIELPRAVVECRLVHEGGYFPRRYEGSYAYRYALQVYGPGTKSTWLGFLSSSSTS